MPVPRSAQSEAPRRLLRDVVYDQLHAAVLDGTLEPGERLNDDELTAWLGVSRTPVREAISRLASEGLVEMAANRYTRVTILSGAAHADAAALLDALQQWAVAHASNASAKVRARVAATAAALTDQVAAQDVAAYRKLHDAAAELIAGLQNPLFTATEAAVRSRVSFHAAASDTSIDWPAAAATTAALAAL